MDNAPASKGWRNPAIIAGIITAIAAIIAAIIGLIPKSPSPETKISEPARIEQRVEGSGNTQIGQARDVDIKSDGQNTQKK